MNEARCIGCECTDLEACPGGCSWLYVDYEIGYGICSSCPEVYEEFLRRDEPEGSRVHVYQDLEEFTN